MAVQIGITTDEAASYLSYINEPWGNAWGAVLHTNTLNNHVLNSLAVKITDLIWPWNVFVMRVPSLIALLLFSITAWLLARKLEHDRLRAIALVVFLSNPFALQYFSLARGYSIAILFELLAGLMLLLIHEALSKHQTKQFVAALLALFLSVQISAWGHFAFLFSSFSICFVLVALLVARHRDTLEIVKSMSLSLKTSCILGAASLLPILYIPGMLRQAALEDSFAKHNDRLIEATIGTNIEKWLMWDLDANLLAYGIVLLAIINIVFKLYRREAPIFSALFITMLLTLLAVTQIMEVSPPQARFSIFVFPAIALIIYETLSLLPANGGNKLTQYLVPGVTVLLAVNVLVGLNNSQHWEHRVQDGVFTDALKSYKVYLDSSKNETTKLATSTLCFQERDSVALWYQWQSEKLSLNPRVRVTSDPSNCTAIRRCVAVYDNDYDACRIETTEGNVITGIRSQRQL